jgi:hypothetical protein
MITFLDSDLRDIFASSPFSTRAMLDPGGPNEREVPGFYNSPRREQENFPLGQSTAQARVAADEYSFTFRSEGPGGPMKGDFLEIGGRRFMVRAVLHDGQGLLTAFLRDAKEGPA